MLMATTRVKLCQRIQLFKNQKSKKLVKGFSKWKVQKLKKLELELNHHLVNSNLGI